MGQRTTKAAQTQTVSPISLDLDASTLWFIFYIDIYTYIHICNLISNNHHQQNTRM
jgi:hypothetical protein